MDNILKDPTVLLLAIIAVQLIALIVQAITHRATEKDLLNRLMSRNFGEYVAGDKALTKKPEKPKTKAELKKEAEDSDLEGFSADGVPVD